VYAQLSNASSVRYRQFLPDAIQPSAAEQPLRVLAMLTERLGEVISRAVR
jgi:hypothetical protein